DDLVTFHVDGTHGSAAAGLQKCWSQARGNTPRPVWNPGVPQPIDFFETWSEVPGLGSYDNGFKVEWEMFIRHLYDDAPFKWTLLEGAKGVQLAEAGLQSWKKRCWIDVPELKLWRNAHAEPPCRRRPACAVYDAPRKAVSGCGAAVQPRRLRGRACGRRSTRRQRPVAHASDRLGSHHRVSQIPLVAWSRRCRSHGHGPARHGPRLADVARVDLPQSRRRQARARCGDRVRRRHRSSRARAGRDHR